ncbi:DUF6463 family protein [Paenibacillus sp. GCM10027627]|uniref:DUF6463 family protein n=1 Tax=unclassified Paenibacillus TaxID=185978 RepID=UPI00363A1A0A
MIRKLNSGAMLAWTAALHTVIGAILFWQPLVDIWRDGLFGAVGAHLDRGNAFWFLMFGFAIYMYACLIRFVERTKGRPIPRFVAIHLLMFSIIGLVFVPLSGFWLVIPQALLLFRKSRLSQQ